MTEGHHRPPRLIRCFGPKKVMVWSLTDDAELQQSIAEVVGAVVE